MRTGLKWGLGLVLGLVSLGAQAQTVVKYVHTDALGSVVAMTDASGAVIETTREYEPYGLQLVPSVQDGPGYTGHVQDAATGLTYMQQRYYDPLCGCFLSVDPVTAYSNGDLRFFNRYAYAFNNPYRFTDPDGRCPDANPCFEATPFNIFRDTFSGRMWAATVGDTIALFRSDNYNPLSNEFRSAGQLQDAKFNLLLAAAPVARIEAGVAQSAKGILDGAAYAQRTFSQTFSSTGKFAGQTIDDVAGALQSGAIKAADVPVQYIVRDGNTLILNTRSAQALEQAGIPRSQWNAIDMTGNAAAQARLTNQLRRNGLDDAGIQKPISN